MDNDSEDSVQRSLVAELKRSNELTTELIRIHRDWRLALRQGLLAGLGGAVGATVLVSLLVWMLQPLKRLEAFKPTLDRIGQELERRPAR